MSHLVADFLTDVKVKRFTLKDVDTLIACGEKLSGDDQLAYFEEFRVVISNMKEEGPVITYALQLIAYQVYILAGTQAGILNSEERWEESLRYCQSAERALPQFKAISTIEASQLYAVFGNALLGLKRYTEAYKTFMRANSAAQELLSNPNVNLQSKDRDHLHLISSHCQKMLKDLESQMKQM